jgi:hypothetical protein
MNTELKQRKSFVHRKRVRPTERAQPEEVCILHLDAVFLLFKNLVIEGFVYVKILKKFTFSPPWNSNSYLNFPLICAV